MGSVVVEVKVRGVSREAVLRALVDTGFYGDLITASRAIEGLGIELRHERLRRLPDGRLVKVRFGGGEIEVMGLVVYGDVEVWDDLKLPEGIDALLGVTALERLGLRINPRTGELEKTELYLL
ncbi:hypothetical protein IG193_02005 [Infirmifilum lucidum]|uniref:Aspartyl protease n=1 Tax=Infirmifilum lucidum TaxID=2776706 RepID=A0A7L9FHI2_9CREN|nr:hypothetical protein [Infirmifilum lucidum]QOJ79260.1 hypothetical protein IG193_02005 [Infirmifilum lucidum]